MPTEPERDIEQQLRDYARHRADTGGTPPALHPAMRKRLQDEVARQNIGARRTTGLGLFWASWPGFILKGSLALTVLVVSALVLAPLWRGQPVSKPVTVLAKNEERSARRQADEKKDASANQKPASDKFSRAAPPSGGVASRKMDQSAATATESLRDADVATNPVAARNRANPVVTSPVTVAPALAMKALATPPATAPVANAVPALTAAPITAPSTPAAANVPAPVTASDSAASMAFRPTGEMAGLANLGSINQQFTRVNPPAAGGGRGGRGGGGGGGARGGAAALRTTVLQSFRVEQTGGQIRVIDSDGSIYTGVVNLAGNVAAQSTMVGPAATFAAAAQPTAALGEQKAKASQNALAASATISPAAAAPAMPNAPANAAAGARSNASRSDVMAANYYFRVSGTNLTLNQPVEFSGNFVTNDAASSPQLTLTASTAAGDRKAGGAGGGGGGFGGGGFAVSASNSSLGQTNLSNQPTGNLGQATGGALAPAPFFNFRLQGQAVIGTNRLGITALPARP